MATASAKNKCVICQKERSEVRCEDCFQTFCYKHLIDHRQEEADKTFDEIQMNHNEIRQTLNEQIAHATKHYLVKQIDQWELDSIAVIQRTARECRQKVLVQIDEHLENLEARLTQLTDEIKEAHRENDWNENNINQLKEEFTDLRTKLNQVPSILIQEDSKPFIKKITVFSTEANTIETEKIVLKIIVLGDSEVGKTSLLRQYTRNPSNKCSPPSRDKPLTKEIRIDNHIVILKIWDTFGHECLRSITATFYPEADGCVLVYDVTSASSFHSLNTWREHFLNKGKIHDPENFPFVVIGTNADLENREVDIHTAQNWCKGKFNIPYFETSQKDNINLVKAFKTLARNVLAQRNDLNQTTDIPQSTNILPDKQSSKSKNCHVS